MHCEVFQLCTILRFVLDCRHLLHRVLEPDPTKRISLEDLVSHSWVTDGGRFPLVKPAPVIVPKNIRDKVGYIIFTIIIFHIGNPEELSLVCVCPKTSILTGIPDIPDG